MLAPARLRIVLSFLAVAASLAALPLQRWLAGWVGRENSYDCTAGFLLATMAVAIAAWPPAPALKPSTRLTAVTALSIGCAASMALVYWTALALLPAIFAGPPDVNRADMLVIIDAGVRRALEGHTPYAIYHVPWETTLMYGPALWGPFTLPVLAHADLRVLTMTCLGAVAVALTLAAAQAAAERRWLPAVAVMLLTVGILAHPDVRGFFPIGHTLVYWPLLLVLCALLARDRWIGAAAALGLIVAARSTMVSLVPVFLLAAYHNRRLDWRLCVALGLTSIGPFLPFVLADPRSVEFGMYGTYIKTMKGFVWTSTRWAHETIGVTGALLRVGAQRYTELIQVLCLAAVYVASWFALRRGGRPEPWMALALLVFSMTALWPVAYLYYDVWVLIVGAFAFRVCPIPGRVPVLAVTLAIAVAASLTATLAAGAVLHGRYDLDLGTTGAAPMTGGGFGSDQPVVDGGRTLEWVEGNTARVRVPRAALSGATILVDLKPYGEDAHRQRVRADLNGHTIGDTVSLDSGWQTISFRAPANRWIYGFNVLTLTFSRTIVEPASKRELSVGIDRIRIQ